MKEAGLPNITGSTGKTFTGNDTGLVAGGNGCFGATKTYNALYPVEIGNGVYSGGSICISFDASYSNSIYGASTTVQPPAVTVRYFIKAA